MTIMLKISLWTIAAALVLSVASCSSPARAVINDNLREVARAGVAGVLVDSAGTPAPGLRVLARVNSPWVSLVATTDAQGAFSFDVLRYQTPLPATLPETVAVRIVAETPTREVASTVASVVFDSTTRPTLRVQVRLQRVP